MAASATRISGGRQRRRNQMSRRVVVVVRSSTTSSRTAGSLTWTSAPPSGRAFTLVVGTVGTLGRPGSMIVLRVSVTSRFSIDASSVVASRRCRAGASGSADLELAGLNADVDLDHAVAHADRVGVHRVDRGEGLHLPAEEV